MDYLSAKFQCCRLSFAGFIDKLRKHNDDVIMTPFHVVGVYKISNFVNLNIDYLPPKFQIPWLSASNFMVVSVRPQKHNYDVIFYYCVSKLAYFVEHGIGNQPSKFQCSRMSGSNFMDGGQKDPPVLQRDKKAQCL